MTQRDRATRFWLKLILSLHFYPRDAMLARVLAVIVCLCVCLSHACIVSKWLKGRITQSTPSDSSGTQFSDADSRWWATQHSPWKLRSKWPTPFLTPRFRPICLNCDSWELAKKSSIIINRKSTMRFPSSHRWTLCVTPKSPKGWLKTRIFTFGVAFHHVFVAGIRRHFKFGMWVKHSNSQPTDNKPSLKWGWSRRGTNFKYLVP